MHRKEADLAVPPEDVLCAVAMVDVEIHDQDAVQAVIVSSGLGGDGDVVQQAEPHSTAGDRVVSRRPHQAERVGVVAL